MVKQYNVQYFTAKVNGKEIEFRCYTTNTRCGFCHTAHYVGWDYSLTDTKASYYNRTWERFDYESVLKRAIDKLPKDVRQQVYDQLIERKAAEEHEKAEAFIKSFESSYNALSTENKERLANSGIEVHTEGQAKAVAGLVGLMNLMQN